MVLSTAGSVPAQSERCYWCAGDPNPSALGPSRRVEYLREGRLETVQADGEVILCGGAVNSPQVLQLSRIGNPDTLRAADIGVEHALAGVGENLHDHVYITLKQEITKPYSALSKLKPLNAVRTVAQYLLFRNRPAVANGIQCMAFVKTRPGLDEPDVQYHVPHADVRRPWTYHHPQGRFHGHGERLPAAESRHGSDHI